MNKRWQRRGSIAILLFMTVLFLSSCVMTSPLLNIRPSAPVVTIDIPPNRLSVSGPMREQDFLYLKNYLDMLLDEDYHKHSYRYKAGVDVKYDIDIKQDTKFKSELK